MQLVRDVKAHGRGVHARRSARPGRGRAARRGVAGQGHRAAAAAVSRRGGVELDARTAGIGRRSRSRSPRSPWRSAQPIVRAQRRGRSGASKRRRQPASQQALDGLPADSARSCYVASAGQLAKRFVDHVTPVGHPERPERAEMLASGGRQRFAEQRRRRSSNRAWRPTKTCRACTRRSTSTRIVATRGSATMIDEDTFTSPDSDEIARLAAGAVLTGVDRVLDGAAGIAGARAGAAAGPSRRGRQAMGFCLYNNIAVGAAYARSRGCVARRDRRLRRAPRQRHAVDLLRGSHGAVRLVASVSVLSGHRRGRARPGRGEGDGLHPQHSARRRRQDDDDRAQVCRAASCRRCASSSRSC